MRAESSRGDGRSLVRSIHRGALGFAILAAIALGLSACVAPNPVAPDQVKVYPLNRGITSMPLAVPKSGAISANAQDAEAMRILNGEMDYTETVRNTVARLGYPDALEFTYISLRRDKDRPFISVRVSSAPWIALFYREPARTLIIDHSNWHASGISLVPRGTVIADFPVVPAYVRIFDFGEPPPAPPWPVTIPADACEPLAVPEEPDPPPAQIEGSDYAPVAAKIVADVNPLTSGRDFERAQRAFARLKPVAETPGIYWKLYVYSAEHSAGYGVPDGSIFATTVLVSRLDDQELTAVLAHLMAHERYQHARAAATRNKVSTVAALIGGAGLTAYGSMAASKPETAAAGAQVVAIGVTAIISGATLPFLTYLEILKYSRQEEAEANALAIEYLARLEIPPGALVLGVAHAGGSHSAADTGPVRFSQMHATPETAIDAAKMLDAGIVR